MDDEGLKINKWKIVKNIDEGSHGKVLLVAPANETTPKIYSACKMINCDNASEEFIGKFLIRELHVLRKLKHPYIIELYNIFTFDNRYYIMMRYAEQGNLMQFINKYGRLSEYKAKIWAWQITLGLRYMHGLEYAHRDLKCENILITANFNLKLSDFGFSRYCLDHNRNPVMSRTFCGSLLYAPPEIIRGIPYPPKSADMWSFGVIIYVMLNNMMPFNENNVRPLYYMQIAKLWDFVTDVKRILSTDCKSLISHLLEPESRKRWTVNNVHSCKWFLNHPLRREIAPTKSFSYICKKITTKLTFSREPVYQKSTNIQHIMMTHVEDRGIKPRTHV